MTGDLLVHIKYMSSVKSVKIVFAGPSDVGKSSVIHRFNNDNLFGIAPTVGAAYMRKTIHHDGEMTLLDIWDTAGQERFKSMSTLYFRGATYCILVYDLCDASSFAAVDSWKKLCDDSNCHTNQKNPIYYFLIGNKLDKNIRAVSSSEISEYCQNNNITKYLEVSAYNGEGIKLLYELLSDHILTYRTGQINTIPIQVSAIKTISPCYC